MITLDEFEPCQTAAALRQAYANLVAGGATARISFKAGPNGVAREQQFHAANPGALLALVREYEAKCAKLTGCGPRRFGLRAGGRL